MKLILFILLFFSLQIGYSQNLKEIQPTANIRLSFLLFPFTPLLSAEVRTIGNITLQVETNFGNTHGANLKYFLKERMSEDYVFTGVALVGNRLLRKDEKTTYLPYIGYGYAHRFGNKKEWTFDNRIGIGATTNADQNGVYPIIKTGIGRIF